MRRVHAGRTGRSPTGWHDQVDAALKRLEEQSGKTLGDDQDPLLVSVRSGARDSMPGMMDTVLNLGLNDTSVEGLARTTKNERFAWDSYRRFTQMFGNVVRGIDGDEYEDAIKAIKATRGVKQDTELDVAALKELTATFKQIYHEQTGEDFPQDPHEQLQLSIRAVFDSWMGDRAVAYRRYQPHPRRLGHRGQRPADGVRQQGRHLGIRRRVLTGRGHRRARSRAATSCPTLRARTSSPAHARRVTSPR